MTWKRISLELVPPLPEEEMEKPKAPWNRKDKIRALEQHAFGIFSKILRKMNINNIHKELKTYGLPHFVQDHPEYVERGLIRVQNGKNVVPDSDALIAAHDADHRAQAEEEATTGVTPIDRHRHETDDSFYLDPIWNEWADVHYQIRDLKGEIPHEPKPR